MHLFHSRTLAKSEARLNKEVANETNSTPDLVIGRKRATP